MQATMATIHSARDGSPHMPFARNSCVLLNLACVVCNSQHNSRHAKLAISLLSDPGTREPYSTHGMARMG